MAELSGSDTTASARLKITGDDRSEASVLRLAGELDIASAPLLERAIAAAQANTEGRALVIDLGEVTFMDSTGLRALLGARQVIAEAGRELTLRPGPRQVQRVFELSGTADSFTFED
jgi:anti-anti-sigma factor